MPGARWFPGATVNYAHHALRNLQPDAPAITALDETGACCEITGRQLRARVASVAATLRDLGVGQGDRVVGYLPNTPPTPSSPSSPPPAWARCGRCAARTTYPRPPPTASRSSKRRC
jgi:acetoacetyl-CoA synthetase